MGIASMCKTAACLFVVLFIGGIAIAWRPHHPLVAPGSSVGLNPSELQVSAALPAQEMNDMTFVFTSEH